MQAVIGLVVHAIRLKKLMFHMHLEKNSYFEGPALPFFSLIPWFRERFHATRIVAEPLVVLLASVVLQDLFIIQPGVAIFMRVAALALSLQAYISYHQRWLYFRDIFDGQAIAPVLADLSTGKATRAELEVFHLAGFPKDVPEHIRAEATARMVSTFNPSK
jgi:hypothetical protein